MNARDFCYWLQGFFELDPDVKTLNEQQVQILKNHLRLAFHYDIDRQYEGDQEQMQAIHDGDDELLASEVPKNWKNIRIRC